MNQYKKNSYWKTLNSELSFKVLKVKKNYLLVKTDDECICPLTAKEYAKKYKIKTCPFIKDCPVYKTETKDLKKATKGKGKLTDLIDVKSLTVCIPMTYLIENDTKILEESLLGGMVNVRE